MKHLLLALALLTATAAHAGPTTLVGDQIDAAMIRTIDTGYGLGRIFGYGLDAPFVVQDGNADQHQYSSAFKLDVDGNKFSIRFLQLAGWQDGIVLRLSDLDFSPIGSVLSSVSVNTNLAGYTLTTGADWIDLGLGGTHFTANTYFIGTFDVSSVPEPTPLALVSLGLLYVSALRKRARNPDTR
ncbi:MAG: PEP-CTERM sorting domain-containing protein [Betaproteobacteria bacterium]|jgi:hypothetical protein|nr:PEP-CTERM sorting domain-containing protein [Betaproteobacteria bacterium]HNM22711.1 PEP-CTERM sorting domain-containing protein [Rhodocyclaceae bacterium]HNM82701.1 PEP-CTERM sorting domain-containing protein [Rhodocyclaceae bacterium]HNO88620.1 PEP-CTERM sorting domain-containing protein [Rhodocyclaceae bacterium]